MANYQAISRRIPEVRDFIRNRRWVHRGEVVSYGPNTECPSFSTDAAGFRHSMFRGRRMSMAEVTKAPRYGLMLGSSHLYGFGLGGNENTLPSLLADRFDFPFGNVSMPEASSRNLYSVLAAIATRNVAAPSVVVFMSGGDFTSFCFTRIADPVFGTPNLFQMKAATAERSGPGDEASGAAEFKNLMNFTTLWTQSIIAFCRARKIPLMLSNDTTFFEKREPDDFDRECALGVAVSLSQERQFATQRRFVGEFYSSRSKLAQRLDVPLVGPGPSNQLNFIDEFHYTRDTNISLADELGDALASMIT